MKNIKVIWIENPINQIKKNCNDFDKNNIYDNIIRIYI